LKNEATDLIDNKGPALGKIRNEATVLGQEGGRREAEGGGRRGKLMAEG